MLDIDCSNALGVLQHRLEMWREYERRALAEVAPVPMEESNRPPTGPQDPLSTAHVFGAPHATSPDSVVAAGEGRCAAYVFGAPHPVAPDLIVAVVRPASPDSAVSAWRASITASVMAREPALMVTLI